MSSLSDWDEFGENGLKNRILRGKPWKKNQKFPPAGWQGRASRWHDRAYRWHDCAHPSVRETSDFSSFYEFLSMPMTSKHLNLIS